MTAAYMVWSSDAIAMRPRRMEGPPMKFRLVAAGEDLNTLTPRNCSVTLSGSQTDYIYYQTVTDPTLKQNHTTQNSET